MLWYSYNEMNKQRQENKIIDIKSEDIELKTYLKNDIKIIVVAFVMSLITCIFIIQIIQGSYIYMAGITVLLAFLTISILYIFTRYKIIYNSTDRVLTINKWYGKINIEKEKLKKIYIKYVRRAGQHLYINYNNKNNKEKFLLLSIDALKKEDLKNFLDIFVIGGEELC